MYWLTEKTKRKSQNSIYCHQEKVKCHVEWLHFRAELFCLEPYKWEEWALLPLWLKTPAAAALQPFDIQHKVITDIITGHLPANVTA